MRKSKVFVAGILLGFCFLALGCAQPKPEGPAERIGKGIDEIAGAVRDYDHEQGRAYPRDYPQAARELPRRPECEGSEYYRNPACRGDFAYDDDRYDSRELPRDSAQDSDRYGSDDDAGDGRRY